MRKIEECEPEWTLDFDDSKLKCTFIAMQFLVIRYMGQVVPDRNLW
jgi:hypothetical protein